MAGTLRLVALGLLLGVAFAVASPARVDARPGGGHSYSGGGSSRSSSSSSYRSSSGGSYSGGDAEAVIYLVAFALMIVILIGAGISQKRQAASFASPPRERSANRAAFVPLFQADPGFSIPAFEDFAFELYSAAHRAAGDRARLETLAPYLSPHFRNILAGAPPVSQVVVGSLRVVRVTSPGALTAIGLPADGFEIEVRIEANLASLAGTTNIAERWTFVRNAGVQTKPRDRTRMFACPSCSAPFVHGADPSTCAHCGEAITVGRFDWTATSTTVIASTSIGLTLTGTVEEVGTNWPTVVDEHAFPTMAALTAADPHVTPQALMARTKLIYERLNAAWNAQDLRPVRGLVSASLRNYLQFWIDEYKRQHLANKLDGGTITHIALAKVTRDAYYDAVTLRVYADGFDYTVSADGAVVGGSQSTRRAYSEYWTLLRSAGRAAPVHADPRCPNCGAPLAVSDAGACDHCGAVVEAGAFDFVLSKIEQDEVYFG